MKLEVHIFFKQKKQKEAESVKQTNLQFHQTVQSLEEEEPPVQLQPERND